MKTKIIYISGNELFDISDIRVAFEEVRTALSLDKETILFGVPIDNDDAFVEANPDVVTTKPSEIITEPVADIAPAPIHVVATDVADDKTTDMPQPIVDKPKKSTKHTRAKVVPITPIIDTTQNVIDEPETAPEDNTPVPILSVLGAKSESEDNAITAGAEPIVVTPIDTTPNEEVAESTDVVVEQETQTVSINDMLAEDSAPVDVHEKTLEELLESMTPLGEDEKIAEPIASDSIEEDKPEVTQTQNDEADATLELLATEFAAAEDKIVTPSKTDSRGKIGKLKNILPFKKAKRDDSGLMGDLFGWAGVANDEDFTIPGFFANASSKK